MKITYNLINKYIQKGAEILSEVCPIFIYQGFTRVRIGRSRTSWGSIKKNTRTGACELTISNCFEAIPDEGKAQIRLLSTITHELIHTIPGCMNHGSSFKYYAALVNERYPELDIQRTHSMTEFGIKEKEPTYIVQCGVCHRQWSYHRKPRCYEHLERYVCPICNLSTLFFSKIPNVEQ